VPPAIRDSVAPDDGFSLTLVFYISGHGFGHASRDVEILHAVAALAPDARIIIRSAVQPGLLQRTLRVGYELRPGDCDTGIVQRSSIEQDDAATVDAAIGFYANYEPRIAAEVAALSDDRVSIVVGDIAPIAFEVASHLGVPGLAVGNFTWDWIYETHPGLTARAPWLVPTLRASYAKATLALQMPFPGGFEVFPDVRAVPLVARHPSRSRAETRSHFGLPVDRPIALLSFGGYGLPDLDIRGIDALDRWTVVTTDRIRASSMPPPAHVHLIPEEAFIATGFRYEDLVGAVDAVLTKPGFGITAECITTGTAMLYTSRGEFREYDVLVRETPRYVRTRFISNADLLAGRWKDALETLVAQPAPSERLPANGAEVIAQAIVSAADASSSG
jgi:L-arabinokinase